MLLAMIKEFHLFFQHHCGYYGLQTACYINLLSDHKCITTYVHESFHNMHERNTILLRPCLLMCFISTTTQRILMKFGTTVYIKSSSVSLILSISICDKNHIKPYKLRLSHKKISIRQNKDLLHFSI